MPRGSRTIQVRVKATGDWQGDPQGADGGWRDVVGCILIPRLSPDDEQQIIEGYQVFVPPDQTPPLPEDEIKFNGVTWEIDGNVGDFEKKSGDRVGDLFAVKRLR